MRHAKRSAKRPWRRAVLAVLTVGSVLVASSDSPSSESARPTSGPSSEEPRPTSPSRPNTLREHATRSDLLVGTAVDVAALEQEADYRRVLTAQFNAVTPENEMKWSVIHPEPDRYDFTAADRLVAFAGKHRMTVRGHALAWHSQNPAWLENAELTREQAIVELRDHIHTVVGRYRGRVAQWDVVNEAMATSDSYSDSPWMRAIGPDYIAMAFRFAHEADPSAKLYYNDFDVGGYPGSKAPGILELVRRLVREGAPIDGVGMQFHAAPGVHDIDFAGVADQMQAVRALGLDYAITEYDYALTLPASQADLEEQGKVTRRLAETCLAAPNCRTFIGWGFTDRHSWVPSVFPDRGKATLFDEQLRRKPAFGGLLTALRAAARQPPVPE